MLKVLSIIGVIGMIAVSTAASAAESVPSDCKQGVGNFLSYYDPANNKWYRCEPMTPDPIIEQWKARHCKLAADGKTAYDCIFDFRIDKFKTNTQDYSDYIDDLQEHRMHELGRK